MFRHIYEILNIDKKLITKQDLNCRATEISWSWCFSLEFSGGGCTSVITAEAGGFVLASVIASKALLLCLVPNFFEKSTL